MSAAALVVLVVLVWAMFQPISAGRIGRGVLVGVAVLMSLIVLGACQPARQWECNFSRQAAKYVVAESDLNKNGVLIQARRDGRVFAFKRSDLVACVLAQ